MLSTVTVMVLISPAWSSNVWVAASGRKMALLSKAVPASKMPATVTVRSWTVNVEPTCREFLVANVVPTRACVEVAAKSLRAAPSVMLMASPLALRVPEMPVASIGMVKVRRAVLPVPDVADPELFARLPSVPGSTAEVRLVVPPAPKPPGPPGAAPASAVPVVVLAAALLSRADREPVTSLTWATAAALVTSADVRGSPPPWPPRAPAGLTVRLLPTEALSELTLAATAWLATSMDSARPIATAKMTTTAPVRTLFRNALPTLRAMTLIFRLRYIPWAPGGVPSSPSSGHPPWLCFGLAVRGL